MSVDPSSRVVLRRLSAIAGSSAKQTLTGQSPHCQGVVVPC